MRAHSHVLALSRHFDVTLVIQTPHRTWTECDVPQDVRNVVKELLFFKIPDGAGERRRQWIADNVPGGHIINALNPAPELCRKFFNPALARRIAARLHGRRFDGIHIARISMLRTAQSVLASLRERPARIVLDEDDIESKTAARRAEMAKGVLGHQIYFSYLLEAAKFRYWEKRALSLVDTVILCSSIDSHEFNERYGATIATVVPNTVADPSLTLDSAPRCGRNILFVGNLRYPPNLEAITDFVANVMPEMRLLDPRPFTLKIVGLGADTFKFDTVKNPEIEVHADVPDLEPYYRDASIVIAPIRWGGGTRIKIIEAFSYGKPVVATSIGAEGLSVTDGDNILLRDGNSELAHCCVSLMNDPELQRSLGSAARKLFLEKYSPQAAESALVKLYSEAL